MENPEIKCRMYSPDRFTIRRTTGADDAAYPLVMESFGDSGDEVMKDAFITADDARKFARGILAMCDEVEPPAASSRVLEIGARVRVVEDDPDSRTGEFVGAVGTLYRIDDPVVDSIPYGVRFEDSTKGFSGEWFCSRVELVDEPDAVADVATETDERAARVATLETARRIAGDSATAHELLRIAAYLEGN